MLCSKKAKRARIEEIRRQNENEAHLMECARAEVIMRAKSLAERACISFRKEENTKLTAVEFVEPITAALSLSPLVSTIVPSNAVVSPAPLALDVAL